MAHLNLKCRPVFFEGSIESDKANDLGGSQRCYLHGKILPRICETSRDWATAQPNLML
jgi:hypothetical protein